MTDIDIARLKKMSAEEFRFAQHHKDCIYENPFCAVMALIERLEVANRERDRACQQHEAAASRRMDAEAQRDRLAEALRGDWLEEKVGEYELRGDEGDYTPNECERLLIRDFAHGLLADLSAISTESKDE